jgi:predicted 3-demethylubiquinone-9 3-methyltransferase (glyoxalase superfamily)
MPPAKTVPPLSAKILPHLWFDSQAKEAAEFYSAVFPGSKVDSVRTLRGTPSGRVDVVSFHIADQSFMAISAGPLFKINPSISFFVNFDPSRDPRAREGLDAAWKRLTQGGLVRMPLQEYPFSKRYGWVEDRYGVNWQLILTDPAGEPRPFIVPSLMFVGKNAGRAEEAIDFYVSLFKGTRGATARYGKGTGPDKAGTLMFADFNIEGQWLAAMDSAHPHDFQFNEAVSIMVRCKDQEEIDRLWSKMSAVPSAEQCGWLKDKFGVSWQIVPAELGEMMGKGTQEQVDRVTQAFLPMKKFDIATLRKAYEGRSTSKVQAR